MVERDGGGRRVLLMDDNPMVGEATRQMIEFLGYTAELCSEGGNAVRRVAAAEAAGAPFEAVVLDLTVDEGMGGEEAARLLRVRSPGVRLVAVSGFCEHPVMVDPTAHGFDGAIAKPFQLAELGDALRSVRSPGRAIGSDTPAHNSPVA